MNVTRIEDHQARDIEDAVRDMVGRLGKHQMRGLGFCMKVGPYRHIVGFTGDYLNDPFQALACCTRMEYKANQLLSVLDDDHATRPAPL